MRWGLPVSAHVAASRAETGQGPHVGNVTQTEPNRPLTPTILRLTLSWDRQSAYTHATPQSTPCASRLTHAIRCHLHYSINKKEECAMSSAGTVTQQAAVSFRLTNDSCPFMPPPARAHQRQQRQMMDQGK